MKSNTSSGWGFDSKKQSAMDRLLAEQAVSVWKPARLTGTIRWRPNSNTNFAQQIREMEREAQIDEPMCSKQFALYCDYTTMHGIRYTGEPNRTYGEKVFWAICVFGMMCTAIYMMSSIYLRWSSAPVITSVANTNLPVTNINFPAVTVCTVNKAVNEKLVIQACRYNLTFTQIQTIISKLVDPEARNNDNSNPDNTGVNPKTAIKYLRLTAPKCDNYLLTCRWNNAVTKCTNLFKLTLTDSGYCCSFNTIQQKYRKSDPKNDAEVRLQEEEFDFLQKAVWDYVDSYMEKNPPTGTGPGGDGTQTNTTSSSTSYSCNRTYGDELFPGVCRYLDKCRLDPKSCNLIVPNITTPETNDFGNNGTNMTGEPARDRPFKATGAGRSRGLVLMLDTLRCDAVPTDSFKGLRVFVHDPDEFPAVSERGFIVSPGYENQIAIIGNDIYSEEVLKNFSPETRGCYYTEEFPLKNYEEYSRSSCVIECETEYVNKQCGCTPYYSPGNYSVCSTDKVNGCVRKALDIIQKKQPLPGSGQLPVKPIGKEENRFDFTNNGEKRESKSCSDFCLPACTETSYTTVVTSAPFPNQPEPNKTKMIREAINDGRYLLNDIGYVENSVSVLRVFFRQASVVQFKRDELFAWEDFVSNLGGVMGLCLGFSILSVIELIYFFTIRHIIDWYRYKKHHDNDPKRAVVLKDSWDNLAAGKF